ncbi:efflux RND transporter periplasmic adaptor subunit [uncultured Tateyamaria sp.]|uniref:efflux RND transporter periplasmic adaptor subunit n=1 Tax=uncultured Tateyamaria sp. TaxID=455651 RepID=UPI002618A693|nr:efflux RND transporter periplasmic adaptor subunit [uncultured Tateyamaria sp.]
MWMTQPKEDPATPPAEIKQAVRFETVVPAPVVLGAEGFGRVTAVREWSAVSQVDGRVSEMLQGLAIGAVVEAGTLLVQVDQTDFILAISKSEANIAAAEASLNQLTRQEANSRNLMEVEQRSFDVAQAEYDRIQQLFERGTTTGTALDAAKKTLLAAENSMVNLNNALALYPSQRASAQATVALRQAELAEAQRGLANTTISAPFRGRVSSEAVETGQFVRTGTELLKLVAIDQFEVVGAFSPRDFGTLVRGALSDRFSGTGEIDATDVIGFLNEVGIGVFVTVDTANGTVRYPATLTRFRGSIDDATGTVGLAVRVDDPLMVDTTAQRPPLEIGGFVTVRLEAAPADNVITVPRAVVRQDDAGQTFVYMADAQDRLATALVTLGPVVRERVVVSEGLSDRDRVVLSDPRPPIEGLALTMIPQDGSQ